MPKHIVLYGPPGCGKTHTLIDMIGTFRKHRPTQRVLFCSHTRAAAQEAMSRWGNPHDRTIDIQTLHSVCFRALNLSKAQTVDDAKLEAFGEEYGIDMSREGLGPEFTEVLSMARSRGLTPEEGYDRSARPGTRQHFLSFVTSYNMWRSLFGFMDFNDMLEVGAQKIQARDVQYGLVVIDEAQDLTPLHWKVVYRLMELLPKSVFLVAGDDDQTLYSFTGADPHGMMEFSDKVQAEVRILSQSYRVPVQVFDLAQAIIQQVTSRVPKEYKPRMEGVKPARGLLEMWPHMEHMQPSRDRDTLVLYADRFVRSEVEPLLQAEGYSYRALNGFPSPQDTKAGRAIRAVLTNSDQDIAMDDDLRSTVRAGLSKRGAVAWDTVSIFDITARIRRGDWSVLAVKNSHEDYLKSLDYNRPQNIRISTMHGAKGLQGDDVHLILSLSSRATMEAAIEPDHLHRLLYTAVTRTKENLYMYDGENAYELPAGGWK